LHKKVFRNRQNSRIDAAAAVLESQWRSDRMILSGVIDKETNSSISGKMEAEIRSTER